MQALTAFTLSCVPGVRHSFFTRHGGVSPHPWNSLNAADDKGDVKSRVHENRARICQHLGIAPKELYLAKQIHSSDGLRVTKSMSAEDVQNQKVDALWTTEKGLALAINTADCAPILLASKDGRVVAAIHAGWRGAVGGLIPKVTEEICGHLALNPQDFVAAIGPCIGLEAFEVGEEVIEQAARAVSLEGLMVKDNASKYHLHLAGLVQRVLHNCGVENVENLNICTVKQKDRFFSHRGDKGQTGRQISAIVRA